jgi:hypothetical protein
MGDPRIVFIDDLSQYLNEELNVKNIYSIESRNIGASSVITIYAGNPSDFSNFDQRTIFRIQLYTQDATFKKTIEQAWRIRNEILKITPDMQDFLSQNKLIKISALDEPGAPLKNTENIFWITQNFEVFLQII